MSFAHPTAETNSAGQNPDPLVGVRLERAREANRRDPRALGGLDPIRTFFTWDFLTNDVLTLRPFDSLPRHQQDRIRERRQRQFRESSVPWIVNDATSLLTLYDDVDDLMKAAHFSKLYGLDPAAALLRNGRPGLRNWFRHERDIFLKVCDDDLPRRERKLLFGRVPRYDFASFAGLLALAKLFPQWRGVILGIQALQALHTVTGVGLQIGPTIGLAMEVAARGLAAVGLPFTPASNKYHQILAARITQRSNKGIAAMRAAHGDDAMTIAFGINQAGKSDFLPQIAIDPQDYPSVSDVLSNPWQQVGNLGALAASLPGNIAAYIANELIPGTLRNWACALLPTCDDSPITGDLRAAAELMRNMAEEGICPGPFCDAELSMGVNIWGHPNQRQLPGETRPLDKFRTMRNLRWKVPLDIFPEPSDTPTF